MASSDYGELVYRNRHWNFTMNMLEMSFWTMAMSFVFSSTILPLYTSYLTSSMLLIGFVVATYEVSFYLPQLFIAPKAEKLLVKKPLVLKATLMERLPFFFVASPGDEGCTISVMEVCKTASKSVKPKRKLHKVSVQPVSRYLRRHGNRLLRDIRSGRIRHQ